VIEIHSGSRSDLSAKRGNLMSKYFAVLVLANDERHSLKPMKHARYPTAVVTASSTLASLRNFAASSGGVGLM
jgi:hypothetical protein